MDKWDIHMIEKITEAEAEKMAFMPNSFTYKGYHFTAYKQINLTFAALSRCIGRGQLNFHKYEGGKGWSYKNFYKASGNSTMDIFLCQETGEFYIPGENELFLYLGDCS